MRSRRIFRGLALLISLVLLITMVACGGKEKEPEKETTVSVTTKTDDSSVTTKTDDSSSDKKEIGLKAGELYKLKDTIPEANKNDELSFSSSNLYVASVDEEGQIYAEIPGQATITVTSKTDKSLKNEYMVTVTPVSDKPVTLKVMGGQQGKEGILEGGAAQQLKKYTNITIDYEQGNETKFQVRAAAADLPDIFLMHGSNDINNNVIKSGAALRLDDLLDKYGNNKKRIETIALKAIANGPVALEKDGKPGVYSFAQQIKMPSPEVPNENSFVGFFTRWDKYLAIGAPVLKNEDDYLAALKKMVELEPETKTGRKIYAFSSFSDWGWNWALRHPYAFANGMEGSMDGSNPISVDLLNDKITGGLTNPDSYMWKAWEFFNKAQRMGLVDPEVFIIKQEQYAAKIQNGELLVSGPGWLALSDELIEAGAMLAIIPGSVKTISQPYPDGDLFGTGQTVINSKTQYPEACIALFDYYSTTIGARSVFNGVFGTDWDTIDGKPQTIGEMKEIQEAVRAQEKGADEFTKYMESISDMAALNFIAGVWSRIATDGYHINLNSSSANMIESAKNNEAMQAYANYYGVSSPAYRGMVYVDFINKELAKRFISPKLIAVPENEDTKKKMNEIRTPITDYLRGKAAVDLMFAKTPEEFQAVKAEVMAKLKELGAEELEAYNLDLREKNKENTMKILGQEYFDLFK